MLLGPCPRLDGDGRPRRRWPEWRGPCMRPQRRWRPEGLTRSFHGETIDRSAIALPDDRGVEPDEGVGVVLVFEVGLQSIWMRPQLQLFHVVPFDPRRAFAVRQLAPLAERARADRQVRSIGRLASDVRGLRRIPAAPRQREYAAASHCTTPYRSRAVTHRTQPGYRHEASSR